MLKATRGARGARESRTRTAPHRPSPGASAPPRPRAGLSHLRGGSGAAPGPPAPSAAGRAAPPAPGAGSPSGSGASPWPRGPGSGRGTRAPRRPASPTPGRSGSGCTAPGPRPAHRRPAHRPPAPVPRSSPPPQLRPPPWLRLGAPRLCPEAVGDVRLAPKSLGSLRPIERRHSRPGRVAPPPDLSALRKPRKDSRGPASQLFGSFRKTAARISGLFRSWALQPRRQPQVPGTTCNAAKQHHCSEFQLRHLQYKDNQFYFGNCLLKLNKMLPVRVPGGWHTLFICSSVFLFASHWDSETLKKGPLVLGLL